MGGIEKAVLDTLREKSSLVAEWKSWPIIQGLPSRADMIFVDESCHLSDAMAYQHKSRLHRPPSAASLPPRIKSIDVPCRYCGVPAGEKCVRWNRRVKKLRRSPHPGRVKDTKLANQMLDALKPR